MANIGDTTNPSTNTIYYDALLTTTLMARRTQMVDNIFKESAYLAFLNLSDSKKTQDGGERISVPLMVGKNETVKTVGGYETIDTTPQEGLTTAFYPWAEIAGSVAISRAEERKNSGEGRLMNLLETKIKQAEMSMGEKLNGDLLAGQVSANTFVPELSEGNNLGVLPLGYFLRKNNNVDPIRGGDVGNIAGDTFSFWRHKTARADSGSAATGNSFAINVTSFQTLIIALRRMWNFCGRGSGGFPNLAVADQISYETYMNALDTKVRYQNTQMADMGFETIKLAGATMIWDEVVPDIDNGTAAESATTGTVFFINTKFYELFVDTETDIVTTPFIESQNQTAKVAKVLFMGNTAVSNLRKHGVLYSISQSLSS